MTNKVITAKHSSIVIPDYNLGDCEKIERMLSVWNAAYYKLETVGFHYNEEKKELLLPRGLDLNYLESTFKMPVEIDRNHDEFEPASYRLRVEPKSDIQRKSISYLLGEGNFAYTKSHSQLALNLDTGDGKTYCVIAYLTFNKCKSMIITHKDNIKEQWIASLKKMTDLNDQYIMNIDGSAAINKLLKATKLPYKVYLVNHRTIHSFASKHGWEKVAELFKKLKIGVKVFDEAHLEFENLMRTDLHTNTKKTIYLTATFERSDHKENKVFNLCFKNIAKYGVETRKEKRKHIVYVIVKYNSKPTLADQASVKGRHGFDRNKYIDYQIQQDIFYNALLYVANYVGDKEGKMMMLFSKNEAIDRVKDFLEKEYPKRKPYRFNSVVPEEERLMAKSSDLILSTPMSLGTGDDVPGLRFLINTEQYSSSTTGKQVSGRLREYAPDQYTFYFELVDVGFTMVDSMLKKRLPIFKKNRCAQILTINYDDKKLLSE